jgi:predicted acylesterase/phospholipase RssA
MSSAADRERAVLASNGGNPERLPPADYLAISGGGDDGAFGAGLLVGWTARGDRPVFKVVTGISAGALVAPFAFLGSKYDYELSTVCSRIGSRDIFHRRGLLSLITSDGVADDKPLAALIDKYVTQEVLTAIAREYRKGRLLFIGTTDLDDRQTVIWDMGAIASSHDAGALALFRQVMLASTSIPGIFPPVMIDVEYAGKRYQEMHVDGGVMRQVFLLPPRFVHELTAKSRFSERERHMYVIRNGRIDPQWRSIVRRATTVAHHAIDALIERTAENDLYLVQMVALQDGDDFNVAYIDVDFDYPHKRLFASDYMQHLFNYAFRRAAASYTWRKSLPNVGMALDDPAPSVAPTPMADSLFQPPQSFGSGVR